MDYVKTLWKITKAQIVLERCIWQVRMS